MNKETQNLHEPNSSRPSLADECWLDKQDILTRMHISSRTLQRWRSKGILPFCRIGKKIYYRESALRKLLE